MYSFKKLRVELWAIHYLEKYHKGAHRIRKRTKEQPKYDIGEADDFIWQSEKLQQQNCAKKENIND